MTVKEPGALSLRLFDLEDTFVPFSQNRSQTTIPTENGIQTSKVMLNKSSPPYQSGGKLIAKGEAGSYKTPDITFSAVCKGTFPIPVFDETQFNRN
jgi:hypothetical protein